MEHKRGAEELRGPSTLQELEDWRNNNPVEIADHIVAERAEYLAKLSDVNISKNEWLELTNQNRARMNGTDDDSLMYQLLKYSSDESIPGDGTQLKISDLEDKLRNCWCGSGQRARHCHIR